MANEVQDGQDTPTGTDPDAIYEAPGYEDVSFGQSVERDRQLADELVDETDDVGEAARRFADEATGAPVIGDGSGGGEVGAADSGRLLAIYLGDHRGGAAGGVELVRRVCSQNRGTAFEPDLARLHAEFMDDREALEEIASRLGMPSARVKAALGLVGAKLGVLKPSGRLRRYSPLSRVLELEALLMAVQAKRHLWDALRFTGSATAVDNTMLDRLAKRADGQLETLHRLHREAALLAFGMPEDASSAAA